MITKTSITNNDLSIAAYFLDYQVNSGESTSSFNNERDFAFISENPQYINGIYFTEGHLLLNTDVGVNSNIEIDGTLNISDNDAENVYHLNEFGELIKTIF